MRRLTLHIAVVMLSFVLTSCKMSDRRDVYDHVRQTVRITLNWVNAKYYYLQDHKVERPLAATIMLYAEKEDVETMKLLTNMTTETMNLPLGGYSVVSHNEYGGGFLDGTIGLSGTDAIETYVASWMTDPLRAEYARSGATDYAVVRSSDHLFAFASDLNKVDEGGLVLDNTNFSNDYFLYTITPDRVTMPVTMTVMFKNIDYVASTGSYVYLDGMAAGYNFAEHIPLETTTTHINYLTGRRYITDAEYSSLSGFAGYEPTYNSDLIYGLGLVDVAPFNVFGVPEPAETGDDMASITVRIKLRGEFVAEDSEARDPESYAAGAEYILKDQPTIYERKFDNVKIEYKPDPSGIGPDYLHFEVGAFTGDDVIILPWVADDNSSGSGFNPDVDDWGDEVIVPVPMY